MKTPRKARWIILCTRGYTKDGWQAGGEGLGVCVWRKQKIYKKNLHFLVNIPRRDSLVGGLFFLFFFCNCKII